MIDSGALALLRQAGAYETESFVNTVIKTLEIYCQLTDSPLKAKTLGESKFVEIAKCYLGMIGDDDLIGWAPPTAVRLASIFYKMLVQLQPKATLSKYGLSKTSCHPKLYKEHWRRKKAKISELSLRYWCGWEVISRKGKASYVAIPLLWNKFGSIFAEKVYLQYKTHIETHARIETKIFDDLIIFATKEGKKWTARTFKNPIEIRMLFQEFMLDWFMNAAEAKKNIYVRTRAYSKFIHFVQEAFIQSGEWAKPFLGELPVPRAIDPGNDSNIKETSGGIIVKDKLITPVPIHLTDSQAIEIIFKTLDSDVTLVHKWAKRQSYRLRKAQLHRDRIANDGNVLLLDRNRDSNFDTPSPQDVAATLQKLGLHYIRNTLTRRETKYSLQRLTVSVHLALPGVFDLFPFKLLLIHEDQRITEAFLDELELYNKNNVLSGFLKTDYGYELIGYKDRRGAKLSEMKINLTPRQAVIVRQIICITAPLRDYLKAVGDDSWRYLFLHTARSLGHPKINKTAHLGTRLNNTRMEIFIDQLAEHTTRSRELLEQLIPRISLTTYRASRAIVVYLEKRDTRELANSLGHSEYRPELLRRYLPEPILDFLQSRWIRVFQKGLICEAMKDSPLLERALNFDTPEQLHIFLANHALREIPLHLGQTEQHPSAPQPNHQSQPDSIVVSISSEILSVLLALEIKVNNSREEVISGIAIYWAKFARLLTQEIERGWDEDLKLILQLARQEYESIPMSTTTYEKAY